jgi:nitrogen fixation NifU-like protein
MDKELITELYQSLILEHSRKPRNFGELVCSHHADGKNPSCGDALTLYLDIQDNIIKDVKFKGEGCAISVSSASLMTQAIKGKNIEEVKILLHHFLDFILHENSFLPEEYEPLHIYESIHNYPLRVKCVLLAWRTLEHILEHEQFTKGII